MKNKVLHNLVDFYLDFKREDVEENRQYLKDAGIDAESFRENMLQLIVKEKGKVKLEAGKRFKETFKKLLNGEIKLPENIETEDPDLSFAFSKLKNAGDADRKDILSDAEIVKLLEYLKKTEDG